MLDQMVVPTVVVMLTCLVAMVTDLRSFKVYNLLTLPMVLSGVAYHTVVGGSAGFWLSLLGLLVGVGVLALPYLLGAFGAGDVKLVAGIGAWLGASPTIWIVVIGLVATAIYSLGALLFQRRLHDAWLTLQVACYRMRVLSEYVAMEDKQEETQAIVQKHGRSRLVPFSVMVGIGVVVNLLVVGGLGWAMR